MLIPGELALLHGLQSTLASSPLGVTLIFVLARYVLFIDLFLLIPFLRRGRQGWHIAGEALWSGGVALAITTILSGIIQRARPYIADPSLHRLIPEPFNDSFPSGHTSVAFGVAFLLWRYDPRLGNIAGGIGLVVALGRMAAGVHFPTDIIGGIGIGYLASRCVQKMHQEIWKRKRP